MKIFSDIDVYEHKYTYDEMKVMSVLAREYSDTIIDDRIDYEDLCRIAEAIYAHWANADERDQEKVSIFPWIEVNGFEEEGYVQVYAIRVWDMFVQLYLEEYLNY